VYVSCHPLFSQLLPPVIRRLQPAARVAHVVTDLASGHAAHFAAGLDACLVPTEQACRQALQWGLPSDKVIITGQPVWPNLRERMAGGAAMRASLGLRDDMPVALMMGGGDGMGAVAPTARAIIHSALKLQLIVVCGRNESLRAELEAMPARMPLRVLGFVDTIPELMGASDILISKSGTLTLCEGLLAGLPILMYDAIPGQEDGNVDYLTQGGAGVFCPTPRAVVDQLRVWLDDPALLARMREAALRLAQPDAAFNVAREVARLAAAVA
jgi:UDP-N-acetylglucosamine:LPS N-acetylglucosamine transferase